MKIAKIIGIAEDIIEIGETIKKLAKEESYIDFDFRANQLFQYAQILKNKKDNNDEIFGYQKAWEEYKESDYYKNLMKTLTERQEV